MQHVGPTFCGVPPCTDLDALDADVTVFGAPHGTPYEPGVASHAAAAAGAVRAALDWFSVGREQLDLDTGQPVMGRARVADCGDVEVDIHDGPANREKIRAAVEKMLAKDAMPLLLGGDDSTPIPMIEAYRSFRKPVTIVQIDAHIDWREDIDGERYGYSSTMRRASEMPHVRSIIQVGARGPGSARPSDLRDALAWGAKIHTARDVHRNGIQPVIDDIAADAQVILAVDVDGLDPGLVPGIILPAFGGLGYQQMLDVIEGVCGKARLVGAAFVEFVPDRDPTGNGAKAIARLASNVIASAWPQAGG